MKCALCKQPGVWSQRFGMILCSACKRRLARTGDVVKNPKTEAIEWLRQRKSLGQAQALPQSRHKKEAIAMSKRILPQNEKDVKCDAEGCDELQFRSSGLCFEHFIEEEAAARNDWDAERQMVLEPLGYVFGDPVEVLA